jgi:hypothetical protein
MTCTTLNTKKNCINGFFGLRWIAEYPPIPTRRITTPSTVTMSRTRGAKSKRVVKKKVKQALKVKKEVQKNVMIDSQRRSPRRKADEETLYLHSDGETTESNRTSAV